MLPDMIYKMLPYIYIVVGLICAIAVESELVYIAAVLLLLAGTVVLWMRHAGGADYKPLDRDGYSLSASDYAVRDPLKKERRQKIVRSEFPIINNNGEIIAFDRRIGSI